jgi:hypothetical protein
MLVSSSVYYFSQTVTLYPVSNKETKLTIWLGNCSEMQLTPNEFFNYVNSKYPQLAILEENTVLAVLDLYDLCSRKKVGSRVEFFQFVITKPCEEQPYPDYLGQTWAIDFICGKELVYSGGNGEFQLLGRYSPSVDPVTGISYTHIQSMYMYIQGSDGYCTQRTGFIKTSETASFSDMNTVVSLQGSYFLVFTN